ncbi:hypothetical protein Trydic_g17003 [Trypoxylus dichotomus]
MARVIGVSYVNTFNAPSSHATTDDFLPGNDSVYQPLVEKTIVPAWYIGLGIVKNFVKALDREGDDSAFSLGLSTVEASTKNDAKVMSEPVKSSYNSKLLLGITKEGCGKCL